MIMLWVLVLVIGFLLAGALRQIGIIHLRMGDDPGALITDDGLDRGTIAPDFEAIDADSEKIWRLSDLPNKPHLLVFLTPSCLACRRLIPHLNEVMATRGREVECLVICAGDLASCRSFRNLHSLKAQMLVDESGRVSNAYKASATPFTYLLGFERQVLVRGIANDWRGLESILEQEGTLQAGRRWSAVGSGQAGQYRSR